MSDHPMSDRPVSDHPEFPVLLRAAGLFSQIGRAHTIALDRRFAALGVTAQQAGLLLHAGGGVQSPSELAALLGTDTAGMTRLLDRLETKGLVRRERHRRDRRAVVVELTETGRALIPRLPPVFGQVSAQLFDGFSLTDLRWLVDACERMLANLNAGDSG